MTAADALSFTALHVELILAYGGQKPAPEGEDPLTLMAANDDLIRFGLVSGEDGIPSDLCFALALAISAYTRREVSRDAFARQKREITW